MKKLHLILMLIVAIALFTSTAYAEVIKVTAGDEVPISWTANTEKDLGGYNIYTQQVLTDEPILLGTVPVAGYLIRVNDLLEGINYITLTAFDTVANESNQSEPGDKEIDKDTTPPAIPTNVLILWKVK